MKKVLLIDDHSYLSIVLKKNIEMKYGVQVSTARNSEYAFKQIEKTDFDLIICDYNFGECMNGLEVLKKLKSDPETKTIPVIIQTSEGGSELLKNALKLGAYSFVEKPSLHKLHDALNDILCS